MAMRGKIFVALLLVLTLVALTPAFAGDKEKLGDAWWTGPLQTPSPNQIPKDHFYVETYFGVQQNNGNYDNAGTKFGANTKGGCTVGGCGYSNDYFSTTLFKYGITNKFNLDILLAMQGTQGGSPAIVNGVNIGQTNSTNGISLGNDGIGAGLRVRTPYQILKYKQGGTPLSLTIVPEVNTVAAASRVWTPGVGLYVMRPFWMPTGRILRIRASEDLWFPMSGFKVGAAANPACGAGAVACKEDKTKYGVTQIGFEYSLTKHWVPAFDFVAAYGGQNKYNGNAAIGVTATGLPVVSQGFRNYEIDPALEYNFTDNTGIIFGVGLSVGGRNYPGYIAPQIALQWFK
jgi:hypothetical protein